MPGERPYVCVSQKQEAEKVTLRKKKVCRHAQEMVEKSKKKQEGRGENAKEKKRNGTR